MSDENYLRQQTQSLLRHSPEAAKLQPHEGNYFDRQVINNEMDRIRAEQTQKAWDTTKKY